MANPLDPIMEWHDTAVDSIRITQRVVRNSIAGAITSKHSLLALTPQERLERLEKAKEELNHLVVLALTATFERTLRDHLARIPDQATLDGKPLPETVKQGILLDIERWVFKDRLVEIFDTVNPQVKGDVKQVIGFRDWVAHGHKINKPPPMQVEAKSAYERLTKFLFEAGIVPPSEPI